MIVKDIFSTPRFIGYGHLFEEKEEEITTRLGVVVVVVEMAIGLAAKIDSFVTQP